MIGILGAGLVVALAGDGYLLNRSKELKAGSGQMQQRHANANDQAGRIATTALLQQRLQAIDDELKSAQDAAATAREASARSEAMKQAKN